METKLIDVARVFGAPAGTKYEVEVSDELTRQLYIEMVKLQSLATRYKADLDLICEMLNIPSSVNIPGLVAECFGGFEHTWKTEPPSYEGAYWFWDGAENSMPMVIQAKRSPVSGELVSAINQKGETVTNACSSWEGYWRKAIAPTT